MFVMAALLPTLFTNGFEEGIYVLPAFVGFNIFNYFGTPVKQRCAYLAVTTL